MINANSLQSIVNLVKEKPYFSWLYIIYSHENYFGSNIHHSVLFILGQPILKLFMPFSFFVIKNHPCKLNLSRKWNVHFECLYVNKMSSLTILSNFKSLPMPSNSSGGGGLVSAQYRFSEWKCIALFCSRVSVINKGYWFWGLSRHVMF